MNDCTLGVKNQARIDNLEKGWDEMKDAITEIRDSLLGRPSWVVVFMFSAMSSIIVGLAMALIAR
ncbi:MAG: hypothetical protein LLF76_02810 [Planctomycetaceae bacterium]|nr:hypothetical protein [Planctomycetaceae bacterium]